MGRKENLPFDPKRFFAVADTGRTISGYVLNQVIFSQGDPADSVFHIQSGAVKITVLSEDGKEAVVALLGAGDFCGEKCLTGEAARMTGATAMNACVVVEIDKAVVIRLVHDEPAFAEWFISYLLDRNSRIQSDFVDQIFNSSEKRLARLLLTLADYSNEGKLKALVPMISQEIMAEMIGTTRPRVNHFMNKFRNLGLIDYNGALHVHSSLLDVLDVKPEGEA